MHLSPDFIIGLRLAIRARFYLLAMWLLLTLVAVVLMASQFSGRQPATVALDIGLSVIRLALPVVIILLVQELLSREFDRRYFLTSLTYPRPRHRLFLGRFMASFTLVTGLLLVMSALLAAMVWYIGQGYAQATPAALDYRYLITIAFIALDLFVITAMGAFLAIAAATPSFILLGTFGFLLIARSYSTIIALLGQEQTLVGNAEIYQNSLELLGYLLPDLAAMDVRMIALYGEMNFLPENWALLAAGGMAYGLMLIGLALAFLHRKRFS